MSKKESKEQIEPVEDAITDTDPELQESATEESELVNEESAVEEMAEVDSSTGEEISEVATEESVEESVEEVAEESVEEAPEELPEAIAEESGDVVEEPEPEQEFEDLDLERLLPMLEALLFAAEEPLNAKEVHESIPDVVSKNVPPYIQALDDWYSENRRGLTVQRVAGGWRLATRPEFADVIRRHLRGKIKGRLSRASLETISIIAYRQPVSRPEVDQMRGVDSSPVIRNLIERELIRIVGRAEAPGRPILYSTTEKFLEYFGLENLGSLPKPEEILGDLDETEAGTKVSNLRSGPFKGAGAGVEEETYRTEDMVHRDQRREEEPDEEQAPVMQPEEERARVEEPDEEEAPPRPPVADSPDDDQG